MFFATCGETEYFHPPQPPCRLCTYPSDCETFTSSTSFVSTLFPWSFMKLIDISISSNWEFATETTASSFKTSPFLPQFNPCFAFSLVLMTMNCYDNLDTIYFQM